jgi:2-amino-4-hydroxy-6-hydroxymethyldihydropteridine diphosphokinase
MARVYLGFGGNLGDVRATLAGVHAALPGEGVVVARQAPLYRTPPMGPPGQPDYLNTVLEVDTALAPLEVLAAVKRIEAALGRVPSVRWGPRALDLDVLLYDDAIVALPTLTVPHAGLTQRRFVLAPLAALVPDRVVPGTGRTVAEHLAALSDDPASVVQL